MIILYLFYNIANQGKILLKTQRELQHKVMMEQHNDELIKVYDNLGEAIREYNKNFRIVNIPKEKDLDSIINNDLKQNEKPNICPMCNAEFSFTNGAYLRSQYGGLTYQYSCMKCHFKYDTGEFFE